jgi:hypothetical protein
MFTNKKDDVVAFLTCGVTTMLNPLFIKTQSSKTEIFLSKIKCYVRGQSQSL